MAENTEQAQFAALAGEARGRPGQLVTGYNEGDREWYRAQMAARRRREADGLDRLGSASIDTGS